MSASGPRMLINRCFNHADREASARCTACGRFYCRECVAEHDGRMICGTCLRKERHPEKQPVRPWRGWVGRAMHASVALAVAWLVFYAVGRVLLSVPSEFHEGTLWQGDWWKGDEP